MLNAIETDNMATSSENSDLEVKKNLSENLSESIKILDQESVEEIFEETKSIHDSVKVAIFRQAIFLIDPSLNICQLVPSINIGLPSRFSISSVVY